MSEGALWV